MMAAGSSKNFKTAAGSSARQSAEEMPSSFRTSEKPAQGQADEAAAPAVTSRREELACLLSTWAAEEPPPGQADESSVPAKSGKPPCGVDRLSARAAEEPPQGRADESSAPKVTSHSEELTS
jgi:hypothetical protein